MVNMKHKAIPNYIYNPEWWNKLGLLSSDHNGLEFQLSPESCVALSLSLGLSEQQFVVSVDVPFGILGKGSITVSLLPDLEMLYVSTHKSITKYVLKNGKFVIFNILFHTSVSIYFFLLLHVPDTFLLI